MIARRDDVVLDARIDDLTAEETNALVAALNRHFAGDGLAFEAPRPDAWFVRVAGDPAISTTPLAAALGRPLLERLPGGTDGKVWQRWQNEIQMLLHGHPMNAARESRGARPVTGVWFWGGGRLRDVAAPSRARVAATADPSGDLVRGYARLLGQPNGALPDSMPSLLAAAPGADVLAITLPRVAGDDALPAFAADWIAPAVEALVRGRVSMLDVVADGAGVATRWHAARPSRFVRLTARWRGSRFIVPSFELD